MSEIKTITVNKGDTLSKIAKDNNTTVADILKINSDIKDPNLILVGQQIKVEEMSFDEVEEPKVITFGASGDSDTQINIDDGKIIETIDNGEEIQDIDTYISENTKSELDDSSVEDATGAQIEEIKDENIDDEEDEVEEDVVITDSSLENKDYVNDVQNLFDTIKSNTGLDYKHKCGALVSDQLAAQGIIDREKGSTSYGKDLAKVLATGTSIINGYNATGYEVSNTTQRDVFENIVNSNNGSLNNLVISFNKGGSFSSNAGHVMLVNKIDNGRVYFVDNWPQYRSGNGYKATSLSISEFEDQYLKSSNTANYMTHLS